eukprot:IDg21423t1
MPFWRKFFVLLFKTLNIETGCNNRAHSTHREKALAVFVRVQRNPAIASRPWASRESVDAIEIPAHFGLRSTRALPSPYLRRDLT